MKKNKFYYKNTKGFTLIEVIVSIIIFGVLGSMIITMFGKNIVDSTAPVVMLKDQFGSNQSNTAPNGLTGVAELMIADFKNDPTTFNPNKPAYSSCRSSVTNWTSATSKVYNKVLLTKGKQSLVLLFPQ